MVGSISIFCYFSLFRFPFNSISRRSSTTKDFNKTRCSVFSCIKWIWSDCSLIDLFFSTLASFRISILVLLIFYYVLLWNLKRLSALSARFIGNPILNFLLFFLSVKSVLVRVFRLNFFRLSVVLCSDLFLGSKNSFFNGLRSFFVFEFIWSLAHDVNWRNRIWRHGLFKCLFGCLRAAALKITVTNCSSIGLCST